VAAALRCLGRFPLVKRVRLIGLRLGALSRDGGRQ